MEDNWDKVTAGPAMDILSEKLLVDQLVFARSGGETERYHTERTLQRDTVGHHSFNVAWLVVLLCQSEEKCRSQLVMAALAHDLAEHKTGDMPAPAKRSVPGLKEACDAAELAMLGSVGMHYETELTPDEKRTLKFADALDGMLFCVGEAALGSKRVVNMYTNFRTYVLQLVPTSSAEVVLFQHAETLWERYYGRP